MKARPRSLTTVCQCVAALKSGSYQTFNINEKDTVQVLEINEYLTNMLYVHSTNSADPDQTS